MMFFLLALGLLCVMEGALYALFPNAMKRMMIQMLTMPSENLRRAGLGVAFFGLLIVYLVTR